jgi:hypothetical protein
MNGLPAGKENEFVNAPQDLIEGPCGCAGRAKSGDSAQTTGIRFPTQEHPKTIGPQVNVSVCPVCLERFQPRKSGKPQRFCSRRHGLLAWALSEISL